MKKVKHKVKVLTKKEVEQGRSNAYDYINFNSDSHLTLKVNEPVNYCLKCEYDKSRCECHNNFFCSQFEFTEISCKTQCSECK